MLNILVIVISIIVAIMSVRLIGASMMAICQCGNRA